MMKRRCDFMTVKKMCESFDLYCDTHKCCECKYGKTRSCRFSFAVDEVEFFDIEAWANEIMSKFDADRCARRFRRDNVMFVLIYTSPNYSENVVKIGHALCNPNDPFVSSIGTAIAYCRAKNWEIPKEVYE